MVNKLSYDRVGRRRVEAGSREIERLDEENRDSSRVPSSIEESEEIEPRSNLAGVFALIDLFLVVFGNRWDSTSSDRDSWPDWFATGRGSLTGRGDDEVRGHEVPVWCDADVRAAPRLGD